MLTLQGDTLHFAFPEVHKKAQCRIQFERALRLPDDTRHYLLPPTLGRFPLELVDDFRDHLPDDWGRHGGVFLPMYQAEALRLRFPEHYPFAVKVAAGKINALTGRPWQSELIPENQDYLVSTKNAALDGYHVGRRRVRQFVAMPLGEGYTAEEQLTGLATHGGLQIQVYPMKVAAFRDLFGARADSDDVNWHRPQWPPGVSFCRGGPPKGQRPAMGLALGGLVEQPALRDRYGHDVWDQTQRGRCFVHLLNSQQYHAVTGTRLPYPPPQPRDYQQLRLPWFHHYHEGEPLESTGLLAKLASVATWFRAIHGQPLPDNDPPGPVEVRPLPMRTLRQT